MGFNAPRQTRDLRRSEGRGDGEPSATDSVLLTAAQAAMWLGFGVDRVRSLIDRGIIKGERVGRDRKVSIAELKAYLRREEAHLRKLGVRTSGADVLALASRR